jgi:hypothetical protein
MDFASINMPSSSNEKKEKKNQMIGKVGRKKKQQNKQYLGKNRRKRENDKIKMIPPSFFVHTHDSTTRTTTYNLDIVQPKVQVNI